MMQILFKARKEERKMGWEERGMVGSEAFFASVSPSLKRIRCQEEEEGLYVGRNRCSVTHISCKICSKIHRIYHRINCGYIVFQKFYMREDVAELCGERRANITLPGWKL